MKTFVPYGKITGVFVIIRLRYGNTNTFFIKGEKGGLLLDTDYAGTLPGFYKAVKNANISLKEITYVLAAHYHLDHMGLIGELMSQGVKLLLMDTQKDFVHFSDGIFRKDNIPYTVIDEKDAVIISCEDSRNFLASVGIHGEIISVPSHSGDSIALVSDDGDCYVGDLEPYENIDGYEENEVMKKRLGKHYVVFAKNSILCTPTKKIYKQLLLIDLLPPLTAKTLRSGRFLLQRPSQAVPSLT